MNFENKKLLVLVASHTNLPLIKAAKEAGCYVITCDNNKDNIGHKYADENIFIDVYDYYSIIEEIKEKNIDTITSFVSSHGLYSAAFISEALGLKGYKVSNLNLLMNKGKFRSFQKNNILPFPEYQSVQLIEQIEWENIVFPVIIKPADSGGSKGVKVIRTKEELISNFIDTKSNSESGEIIIERFLEDGISINGDCLVCNKTIVASIVGEYIFNKEVNNVLPIATLFPADESSNSAMEQLSKIVKLLNIPNGIFNFEAIIKDDITYLIEINPRPSGNYIWQLLGYNYDIDILNVLVNLYLNDEYNLPTLKRNSNKYAYQIFYTDTYKKYPGIKLTEDVEGIIKQIIEFKNPNEFMNPYNNLYDRVALSLIEMKNQEEELKYLNNINRFKL
jgi:biotin carboxylase